MQIYIVVEDELSEEVARRLCLLYSEIEIVGCLGKKGFGEIKKSIRGLNQSAKTLNFFVLTDLDTEKCPSELIGKWLKAPRNPGLVFRVAVREVESWLLADEHGLARYISIPGFKNVGNPDDIKDPKEFVVNAARRSTKKYVRDDLVPPLGSSASQGRGYNSLLGQFVREKWSVRDAMKKSKSLRRTVNRLKELVQVREKGKK